MADYDTTIPVNLVTGKAGAPHVTSADIGSWNASLQGAGLIRYPDADGTVPTITMANATSVTIPPMSVLVDGRYARWTDTKILAIDAGTDGQNRIDDIILLYERDDTTGNEKISLKAKKGTPTSSTPTPPGYDSSASILAGSAHAPVVLARIRLTGTSVTSVTMMGTVRTNPITTSMRTATKAQLDLLPVTPGTTVYCDEDGHWYGATSYDTTWRDWTNLTLSAGTSGWSTTYTATRTGDIITINLKTTRTGGSTTLNAWATGTDILKLPEGYRPRIGDINIPVINSRPSNPLFYQLNTTSIGVRTSSRIAIPTGDWISASISYPVA